MFYMGSILHITSLQHTTTYCTTLQHMHHIATQCNASQKCGTYDVGCEMFYMGSSAHHVAAIYCNALQQTATHCNTLHNTLQHTATHCNTLQHTATHCNTLQHAATHGIAQQHTASRCNTLQHVVHTKRDVSCSTRAVLRITLFQHTATR